jgi:hypothetical protein
MYEVKPFSLTHGRGVSVHEAVREAGSVLSRWRFKHGGCLQGRASNPTVSSARATRLVQLLSARATTIRNARKKRISAVNRQA